jgi:hypothetical protein
MSDSLISGQPLYLLYSYVKADAGFAPARTPLATQATGKVRLHVTGSPPTMSELCCCDPVEQEKVPSGNAAAEIPCISCLRFMQ